MAKKKPSAGVKARRLTANSESKRGKNPASLSNLKPFKPGESGNPSGRPRLLGESYKAWLANINSQGITNAEAVALAMGLQAMKGDVGAAREIRSATEGDKLKLMTWQSEVAEAVKEGRLKPEDVVKELGIDGARDILVAAGAAIPASVAESAEPAADAEHPAEHDQTAGAAS